MTARGSPSRVRVSPLGRGARCCKSLRANRHSTSTQPQGQLKWFLDSNKTTNYLPFLRHPTLLLPQTHNIVEGIEALVLKATLTVCPLSLSCYGLLCRMCKRGLDKPLQLNIRHLLFKAWGVSGKRFVDKCRASNL